jgi:hypothetical protein
MTARAAPYEAERAVMAGCQVSYGDVANATKGERP